MNSSPISFSERLSQTITNQQTQPAILAGLALLMIATRGSHFASAINLPSASWAVFFLAGCYIRPLFALAALIGLAGTLDVAAVVWGGVSADCFGPSYPFLVVAYSALWLGGRWFANQYKPSFNSLLPLVASVLVSSLICSVISSGSYYLLSGSFANPSFAEFSARMMKYYPRSLQSIAFYIGIVTVVHTSLLLALRSTKNASNTEF